MKKKIIQSKSLQELQEALLKASTKEEVLAIAQAIRKA